MLGTLDRKNRASEFNLSTFRTEGHLIDQKITCVVVNLISSRRPYFRGLAYSLHVLSMI